MARARGHLRGQRQRHPQPAAGLPRPGRLRVLSISSADVYGRVSPGRAARSPRTRRCARSRPTRSSKVAADFLGAAGLPGLRPRRGARAGLQPPGAGPDQPVRGPGHRRAHRPQRVRRHRGGAGRQPHPPARLHRRARRGAGLPAAHEPRAKPGEAYNVCSGRGPGHQRAGRPAGGLAHRPMRLEEDPTLQRPVEIPVLRGDPTKLHKATGWEPEIPISSTPGRPAGRVAPSASGPELDPARRPPDAAPGRGRPRSRRSQASSVAGPAAGRATARGASSSRRQAAGDRPVGLGVGESRPAGSMRARSWSSRASCSSTSV